MKYIYVKQYNSCDIDCGYNVENTLVSVMSGSRILFHEASDKKSLEHRLKHGMGKPCIFDSDTRFGRTPGKSGIIVKPKKSKPKIKWKQQGT